MFEFEDIKKESLLALKIEREKIDQREWESELKKKRAVNKVVQKHLTISIELIFRRMFEQKRGKYLKTQDLMDIFPSVPEKRIRYAIKKLKEAFLVEGVTLANHPGKGYRLGVEEDIPIETCKSMLRSLSNLINGSKIIGSTIESQKGLDDLGKELLGVCSEYGRISIQPLRTLENKIKDHPLYGDIYEQLKDLEAAKEASLGDIDKL